MSDWKIKHEEYLKSDHWAQLRLQCFKRAGHKCEACRSGKGLVGHHLRYREPLESGVVEDIMALCDRCHDSWHPWLKENNKTLAMFGRHSTAKQLRRLIGQNSVKQRRKKNKKARAQGHALPTAGVLHQPSGKIDILERVVFEQGKRILEMMVQIADLRMKLSSLPSA
jgi:hypothetical protein